MNTEIIEAILPQSKVEQKEDGSTVIEFTLCHGCAIATINYNNIIILMTDFLPLETTEQLRNDT